jgi:cation diffusion facilitator CzcD-associated flavoprotein CzcO
MSAPKEPDFPGLATFRGAVHPTYAWPLEGADLTNKRVGVVGTGTSAAQVIPFIAQQAVKLTVFQRTPSYAIPLRNRRTTSEERHETAERYQAIRALADTTFAGMAYDQPAPSALAVGDAERKQICDKYHAKRAFQLLVCTFADLLTDENANETAAQYVRHRIAERVRDPQTADTRLSLRRKALRDGDRLLRDLQSRKRCSRGRPEGAHRGDHPDRTTNIGPPLRP